MCKYSHTQTRDNIQRRRVTIEYLCVLFVGDYVKPGLDASFDNVHKWKGIREKAEERNSLSSIYIPVVPTWSTGHP
jgi:hypothetical protein